MAMENPSLSHDELISLARRLETELDLAVAKHAKERTLKTLKARDEAQQRLVKTRSYWRSIGEAAGQRSMILIEEDVEASLEEG